MVVAPTPVVQEPAGHGKQPVALAEPGFATAPKKPCEHTKQAKTEVLPACVVERPAGQLMQLAAPGEGAYEPAAHSEQFAAPPILYCPDGHAVVVADVDPVGHM